MIGLVLLYFAGKAFYELAGQHNRSKWGFAILGVISYYTGLVIGGVIIALVCELVLDVRVDEMNDILLSLMAVPVGILTCWGFYKILQRVWSRQQTYSSPEDILDADLADKQNP